MLPVKQKVCDFKDLTELSCKEFTLKNATLEKDAFFNFILSSIVAFMRIGCPHTGANLIWQKELFFSFDGLFLQCSLHGALFEPDSGVCVRDPCLGECLKPIHIVNETGVVYVSEPDKHSE